MSQKKFYVLLSILAIFAFTLSACKPAAPATEQAPAAEKKIICVIVPPVENPFFGTQQEIAAAKVEELGYTALKMVHDDDANKQSELIDSCIAQKAAAIILDNAGADATVAGRAKSKRCRYPDIPD